MSEIGCACEIGEDYEPARCSQTRIRRARATHVCCECRAPIAVGDQYEVASGIDNDGEPFRFATCLVCVRIWDDLFDERAWGSLDDELYNCLGLRLLRTPPDYTWYEIDEEDAKHRRIVA